MDSSESDFTLADLVLLHLLDLVDKARLLEAKVSLDELPMLWLDEEWRKLLLLLESLPLVLVLPLPGPDVAFLSWPPLSAKSKLLARLLREAFNL